MSARLKLIVLYISSVAGVFLFLYLTNWPLFKGKFITPFEILGNVMYREKIAEVSLRDILENPVQLTHQGLLVLVLLFIVLPFLITWGYYDYWLKKRKATSK